MSEAEDRYLYDMTLGYVPPSAVDPGAPRRGVRLRLAGGVARGGARRGGVQQVSLEISG